MPLAKLSIRLDFPGGGRFGPGKAALLEAIAQAGSISGAARALGMSNPRASKLVEDMNTQFKSPLVETFQGGQTRGGARVTETGTEILALYNDTLTASAAASQVTLSAISKQTKV